MAGSGVSRGGAGKVRSDGIVAGEWLRGYSDIEPCLVLSIRAPYLARVDGQETGYQTEDMQKQSSDNFGLGVENSLT